MKEQNAGKPNLAVYAKKLERKIDLHTSELREQQQLLVHSEKMASIGQLAAGVAHEINNPCGFVMGNLEVLADYKNNIQTLLLHYTELESYLKSDSFSNNIEIKKHLKKLNEIKQEMDIEYIMEDIGSLINDSLQGTERIRKIVQDLKIFSRVDSDEIKNIDINEDIIELALRLVSNELKYKCTIKKFLSPMPEYACNAGELSQVIMNLLINASDAIEENGTITISSCHDESSIRIQVADTGSGIKPEHINSLFDPFFTTKEVGKGTGLGLSISHGIIEKHGGTILASSVLGVGSTFAVTLPLNPELPLNSEPNSNPDE